MDFHLVKKALKEDPYQKVLIPFSGGFHSIVLLLKLIKQRNDIFLYYLYDLNERSGKRELDSILKLSNIFVDYWECSLGKKIFVENMSDGEKLLLVSGHTKNESQCIDIRNKLLMQKLMQTAQKYKIDKICVPHVLSSPNEKNPPQMIEYLDIFSKTKEENLIFIEKTINLNSKIIAKDFTIQDLWESCTPCFMPDEVFYSRIESLPQREDKDNKIGFYEPFEIEDEYNFQGCCFVCDDCRMYQYIVSDIEIYGEPSLVPEPPQKRLKR